MGLDLLRNFWLGKMGSWLTVSIINVAAFSIFWKSEAPGKPRKGAPLNMTEVDYNVFIDKCLKEQDSTSYDSETEEFKTYARVSSQE